MPAVRGSTPDGVPAVKRSTPQAILGEKWGTGKRLWAVVAAVMAVFGVAGIGAYNALAKPATERRGFDANRIAVLYFENRSGNDSLTSLADGVTEALIHELSEVKPLQVISRNGVTPYRNAAVAPDSIGRALKVGTLVEGTIAQSEKRLRVNVSLIDAASGDEIGSKTLERPREEIFDLQDDVAKEVSLFLRERLGQEIQVQALRVGTRNPKAWELVQQAGKLSKDVDALLHGGRHDGRRASAERGRLDPRRSGETRRGVDHSSDRARLGGVPPDGPGSGIRQDPVLQVDRTRPGARQPGHPAQGR